MSDYRFETPRPVDVYVEIGSGSITVTADETGESRVTLSGPGADATTVTLEGRQLNVIGPRERVGFLSGDRHVDVTVLVPTDSRLTVKTGSGDLTARGRYAGAHVRSGSGDVQVDRLVAASVIETGSGDIHIDNSDAGLRAKSGSGDVEVARVGGETAISTGSGDVRIDASEGPVAVKTGSGDLRVGDAQTDVSLSTGSGDLTIVAAHRGRVTSKSASGDVYLGVPAGMPVWTDISTLSGRISSDLNGAGQPGDGDDHVQLRVTTVSGNIALSERR